MSTDKREAALRDLATKGTHHDPMPTRRLIHPDRDPLAFEVDQWWQSYFLSADAAVRRIAKDALGD